MAARQRGDSRESAYLAEENATELWRHILRETRFHRRPSDGSAAAEKWNQRLLYLMAAAVFRSMERLVRQRRWRKLMDTVEAYADGEVTKKQLCDAWETCGVNTYKLPAANAAAAHSTHLLPDDYKVREGVDFVSDAAGYLGAVAAGVLKEDAGLDAARAVWKEPAFQDAKRGHERTMCALIRDIFGNPYRAPAAIDLAWLAWLAWHDGTILNLARTMYANKRFHDLPVLGAALDEAGCADAVLLAHCRGPGPHVRGCWAVDLVLGKN
jgi:hypothetical protein